MVDISNTLWKQADDNNNASPPNGWPEGQPPATVNNCARAMMGAIKRFHDRVSPTLTSGGTGNAYTLTYTVAPTAYVNGDVYSFVSNFANTAASTLNVNGLGAHPIVNFENQALQTGDIVVGQVVQVAFRDNSFRMLSPNRRLRLLGIIDSATSTAMTISSGRDINILRRLQIGAPTGGFGGTVDGSLNAVEAYEGGSRLALRSYVDSNTYTRTHIDNTFTTKTTFNNHVNSLGDAAFLNRNQITPPGIIVLWSGSTGSIPSGWALCNGTNGTPDLRNRFVVGAGGEYAVNASGGADSKSTASAGAHSHGGATASHTLSEAQIPSHTHPARGQGGSIVEFASSNSFAVGGNSFSNNGTTLRTGHVQNTGGGQGHTHGISSDGTHAHTIDVRPRFYALAYIMKL